jgi:hypothetical protein
LQELGKNDCRVTFVAMGKDIDTELLKDLSPYVIEWDIDSNDEPADWETKFLSAYGCRALLQLV